MLCRVLVASCKIVVQTVYLWHTDLDACGILVPQPGIKPMSPALQRGQIPDHWTTILVTVSPLSKYIYICIFILHVHLL